MESFKGESEAPHTIPLSRPDSHQAQWGCSILRQTFAARWEPGAVPSSAADSQQQAEPSFLPFSSEFPLVKRLRGPANIN